MFFQTFTHLRVVGHLHGFALHGDGENRTKLLRSASTHMNQTGRMLVDLPEDAVAGEGGKDSKAQRHQRPVLIIPRTAAVTTQGSRSHCPPLSP